MDNLLKATAAILILATVFFCRGGAVGISLAAEGHHGMDSAMASHLMPCCDDGALGSISHGAVLPDFLSLLVLGVIFLVLLAREDSPPRGFGYSRFIRQRFGSHLLFVFYVILFKLGILHPKAW